MIDISQGSKYALSFEYASDTPGSAHIPRVLNILRLEYTRVVNMSRVHRVQCKLYFKD